MEERKMILKMIEEGKITAEEGLSLLQALEKPDKEGGKDKESSKYSHQQKEQSEQFYKIRNEWQEATEKIIGSANKGATKLVDLFGKAIHKLQTMDVDFDFDFSFGSAVKVTEVFQKDPFEAKDLFFSMSNGSIHCTSWEKEYAQIKATAQVSKVENEQEAREKLTQIIEQKEGEEEYSFLLKDKKNIRVSLEVYLPARLYHSLKLETKNGSVRLSDLEINKVVIETSNGSIRIHDLKGEKVLGKTSNGRIQYQDIQVLESNLVTSNGSINAKGNLQDIQCETTNGGIRIEQEQEGKSNISANTSNGSVRIIYPDDVSGVYGELKTDHGQLKCRLPHSKITEETGQSSQKWYTFEQGEERMHQVKAVSKTGSIHIFEKGEEH